jgi:hypothetical protein
LQLKALESALTGRTSATEVVEARWTVQVLDRIGTGSSSNGRSVQAVVSVTILPSLAPVMQITSSSEIAAATKINAGQSLQLMGSIGVPANMVGSYGWSIDGSNSCIQSLSSVVLISNGDISNITVTASSVPRAYLYYLPLSTRLLPTGVDLLFSLSCTVQAGSSSVLSSSLSYSSSASITIQINSPPRPGIFYITPADQVELTFPFSFTCSQWLDEDLPLSYQFGFVSNIGSEVILRSKLPATFAQLTLPAGPASLNYSVVCLAQIYDAYQSNSSAYYAVRVHEAGTVMTTDDLSSYVLGSIMNSTASKNIDSLKQASAMSSYVLNRVNCSLAPADCGGLNRMPCSRTTHTCGPCLSYEEYVGDDGDSNEMCYAVSAGDNTTSEEWTRRRRALLYDETQSAASAASVATSPLLDAADMMVMTRATRQQLHQQVQQSMPKSCPANCSDHGVCVYMSVLTQEEVSECMMGDVSCIAMCECEEAYASSLSCSMTLAEMEAKQGLRESVISGVARMMELEDADAQSIVSYVDQELEHDQSECR